MGERFLLLQLCWMVCSGLPAANASIRYRVRAAENTGIQVAATETALFQEAMRQFLSEQVTPWIDRSRVNDQAVANAEFHFYERFGPELNRGWPERTLPIFLEDGRSPAYLGLPASRQFLDFSARDAPSPVAVFKAFRERTRSQGTSWSLPVERIVLRFDEFPASREVFRMAIRRKLEQNLNRALWRQWVDREGGQRFRSRLPTAPAIPRGNIAAGPWLLAPRSTVEDRQAYTQWQSRRLAETVVVDSENFLRFVVLSWPSTPSIEERVRIKDALKHGAQADELGIPFRRETVRLTPETDTPLARAWRYEPLRAFFDNEGIPWAYWDDANRAAWILVGQNRGLPITSTTPVIVPERAGQQWAEVRWQAALLRTQVADYVRRARIEVCREAAPTQRDDCHPIGVQPWMDRWFPAIDFSGGARSLDVNALPTVNSLAGIRAIDVSAWEQIFQP